MSEQASETVDITSLPLVPANPLPLRQRMTAAREYHEGQVTLRESGGPVTRVQLGPAGTGPSIVFVMSPTGTRDVLSRNNDSCDRTLVHHEMRQLMGDNLADLPNLPWRARKRTLQPVFTRQHVSTFGHHMVEAAETIAHEWGQNATVDLATDGLDPIWWTQGQAACAV
jgi:cytochrome P450